MFLTPSMAFQSPKVVLCEIGALVKLYTSILGVIGKIASLYGDNRGLWHCRSHIRFFLGPKSSSTAFPCCCKSFQDAQCQAASPDALNRSVFFGGFKRKVLMWVHMGMFISPCKSWGIRWLVIREACKSWLLVMLDDGSFPCFAWPKIGFDVSSHCKPPSILLDRS